MNLDTEARRLARVEATMRAALDDDEPGPSLGPPLEGFLNYEDLTASNRRERQQNNWDEVDLLGALSEPEREEWDAWRRHSRVRWSTTDLATVGLCGVVGGLASVVDLQVDALVRSGLQSLRTTPMLRSWEKAGKRLPIDYTGPNFGGPAHRVRSAGHDLGRPLAALNQIRSGQFSGIVWEDGVRTVFRTPEGSYTPVPAMGEALTRWLQHLLADFVTPMSLPIPGWTAIYNLPSREVRKFAHDVYSGENWGDGVNLRSFVASPLLSVMSTEAIVRTAVHAQALLDTGSCSASPR